MEYWGPTPPVSPTKALAKALAHAIRQGKTADMDMLITAGAPLSGPACGYDLPLFAFCRMGNLALHDVYGMKHALRMTEQVLQRGAPIDELDPHGMTALMWAAAYGHTPLVRLLLDYGASIDLRSPQTGRTALMEACRNGNLDAVVMLIQAKANVSLSDLKELTVWNHAVGGGNTDIMRVVQDALNGVMPKPVHRYSWRNLLPHWMG